MIGVRLGCTLKNEQQRKLRTMGSNFTVSTSAGNIIHVNFWKVVECSVHATTVSNRVSLVHPKNAQRKHIILLPVKLTSGQGC